jgi:hypothetical protein
MAKLLKLFMCNFMNEYNLTIVNFNLLTNNLVQFIIYNIFIQYNNFFKVCSIFIKLCSSRLLLSPYNICKFRAQAKWKLYTLYFFQIDFILFIEIYPLWMSLLWKRFVKDQVIDMDIDIKISYPIKIWNLSITTQFTKCMPFQKLRKN